MDRQSLIGLSHYQNKNGILVIQSPTAHKANEIVAEMLQEYCDSKTALFLSGGSTPKKLYEDLSAKRILKAGAVLQIDERFSEKFHKNSNELMIKNTGLLEYFESQNVRFYPIIEGKDIEQSAENYDEALRFVFKYFPKSVGILGIGADGHTAGIPARNQISNLKNQNLIVREMMEDQSSFVSHYELEGYGERITLNFNALSMLDLITILVLGQEKREVLSSLFKLSNGEENEARLPASDRRDGGHEIEKFPARFYLKPDIAAKTILITDQII